VWTKQVFKQIFKWVGVTIAILMVLITSTLSVLAEGNQSNQGMHQPAQLVGPNLNFEIGVYARPGMRQKRIGYGFSGDRVTVLEQIGSNEGYTWDYIQFDPDSTVKGWVREDFIALQDTSSQKSLIQNLPKQDNQDKGYLGNRNRNRSNQGQGYSQQQQYRQQQQH
jgi:hypothetical protein